MVSLGRGDPREVGSLPEIGKPAVKPVDQISGGQESRTALLPWGATVPRLDRFPLAAMGRATGGASAADHDERRSVVGRVNLGTPAERARGEAVETHAITWTRAP